MRHFMHVHKTVSYVVMQFNKAVATYLRGGKTSGSFRVRGMTAYPSGRGWYRVYGEVEKKGNDLLTTVSFVAARIKNMMMRPLENVQPATSKLFAFEQGFLSSEILKVRRIQKVVYEKVRGHSVPRVVNRAVQASEGFRDFIAGALNSLHQKTVTENKLRALQAKFSH